VQLITLRTIDILLSLVGILLIFPFMLFIYVVGLFVNGSPLIFQTRVGKSGVLFTLVKFRTMQLKTEQMGTHLVDPSLITRMGRLLRRTKLDEIPQLFNVLIGNMSLVGPRPCLPNQSELIALREERGVFNLRPGLTGLAQINKVDMSTPRKLARYDSILVKRLSVSLYFDIVVATCMGKGIGDRAREYRAS
jgi:O-antigen biosynthesis protein WbqP